nr:MAG TPA: hypothetical protein [Caudoviricetes sp.]
MNPGRSDTLRIFCLISVLINPIYKTLSTLMMTHITILGLLIFELCNARHQVGLLLIQK